MRLEQTNFYFVGLDGLHIVDLFGVPPAWVGTRPERTLAESASLSGTDRSGVCVLPLRNIDPGHPGEQQADARASQPNFNPPTRPSMMPSNAIGSIMPGSSMYLHSAMLSAVAGYVDAAGFASLIGLFPAHLTGEIVGDAIAFSSGHPGNHATRLWMLPVFVGSVTTATLVARLLRRNGRRALTGLLALVTTALAAFSASDFLSGLLHESWHLHMLLGGGCAVRRDGLSKRSDARVIVGFLPDHGHDRQPDPRRDRHRRSSVQQADSPAQARPPAALAPAASGQRIVRIHRLRRAGRFHDPLLRLAQRALADRVDRHLDRARLARRSPATRAERAQKEHGCSAAPDLRRLAAVARAP